MKPRVLAADASPSLLEALHISFQTEGFDVYTARSGEEVMDLAAEIEPDVILLGLSLPGRNGYELARGLNQREKFRHIPLFLLTGAFEDAREEQLSGLKYEKIISCPVDSGDVAARIKDFFDEQAEPKTLPEEPESMSSADMESRFKKAWQEKEQEFRKFIAETVRKEILEAERELEKRFKIRSPTGTETEE